MNNQPAKVTEELVLLAAQNLEIRKRKLAQLIENSKPSFFYVEYTALNGFVRFEQEFETLEPAVVVFHELVNNPTVNYALLQAHYLPEDWCGDVCVNLGLHDLQIT